MTVEPITCALPLTGRMLVQNSPARRVPSHGTDLFATTYAIDFVPVDAEGRSAPRGPGAWFGTEHPERFVGFGMPVLAPCRGRVVAVHDGEEDHAARRSAGALAVYALTQASRVRGGSGAIAGNHVILRVSGGVFVLLAHLRRGSLRVDIGDEVLAGDTVGTCGNSGNSTEPHVHLQAMTDADATRASGIPLQFLDYVETAPGGAPVARSLGVPTEGAIVAPRSSGSAGPPQT